MANLVYARHIPYFNSLPEDKSGDYSPLFNSEPPNDGGRIIDYIMRGTIKVPGTRSSTRVLDLVFRTNKAARRLSQERQQTGFWMVERAAVIAGFSPRGWALGLCWYEPDPEMESDFASTCTSPRVVPDGRDDFDLAVLGLNGQHDRVFQAARLMQLAPEVLAA